MSFAAANLFTVGGSSNFSVDRFNLLKGLDICLGQLQEVAIKCWIASLIPCSRPGVGATKDLGRAFITVMAPIDFTPFVAALALE